MPIPKAIAVFNKHVTNKLVLNSRKHTPPLAVVNHVGRKSGNKYRTPIMAFEYEQGFVFALTYGRDVDWVKNLIAADNGTLEYNGEEIKIQNIRHISYDEVEAVFPDRIKNFLNFFSVDHCLIVDKEPPDLED